MDTNETKQGLDLQAIFDEGLPLPDNIEEQVKDLTITQAQVERIVTEAADDMATRARLDAVYKSALAKLEAREQRRKWFMGKVRDWVVAKVGKKKPRRVEIVGDSPLILSLRKGVDRIEVADFAAFAEHVDRSAPDLMGYNLSSSRLSAAELEAVMNAVSPEIREKLSVRKSPRIEAIKEHGEQLGFLPPGCVLIPGEERLTIDPGGTEQAQVGDGDGDGSF